MAQLDGKRVAILATHGFEQSELEEPLRRLREAGADVSEGRHHERKVA